MSHWLRWCHILILKPNAGKGNGVIIRPINTHSRGGEASPAASGHLENNKKKPKKQKQTKNQGYGIKEEGNG